MYRESEALFTKVLLNPSSHLRKFDGYRKVVFVEVKAERGVFDFRGCTNPNRKLGQELQEKSNNSSNN